MRFNYFTLVFNLNFLLSLILGTRELKTDKREFKRLKLLSTVNVVLYILMLVIYLVLVPILILNPVMFVRKYTRFNHTEVFSYPMWLVVLHFSLTGVNLVHSIVLMIFGISNKRYYGNYLIGVGILYLLLSVISLYWGIFLTPMGFMLYYFPFTYAVFFSGIIGTSYLMFFGERIKEKLFILAGISYLLFLFTAYGTDFLTIIINQHLSTTVIIIIAFITTVISSRFIEIGRSFRKGIRVFIAHAVEDYNRYRISDIAQFLEKQKGIRDVYYCETGLMGNTDAWMEKTVPRCQLLVFLSTDKSLNSNDCNTELNIAQDSGLDIIPILGVGLNWDDLKELNIHRELGTEYAPMEFEEFCQKLYLQIHKYTVNKPDEIK